MFFKELILSLNQSVNKYDNIIVTGDVNIDISDKRKVNNNFLLDLCNTFSLQNIITGKTCRKSNGGTSIDIMLTNRPRSFHKTSIFETEISDHHKLILLFFRSYFTRIPPKTIKYRTYKFLVMKSAKNLCNNLTKTNKKSYFQKVAQKGFANNKAFWNTIKPFFNQQNILYF